MVRPVLTHADEEAAQQLGTTSVAGA